MAKNKSRKWGYLSEFEYYTSGVPRKALARVYKISERTLNDWMTGKRPVPWWACEIARYKHQELVEYVRVSRSKRGLPRVQAVVSELRPPEGLQEAPGAAVLELVRVA